MGDYLLLIDGSSLLSTQYFGNLPREILYAKKQEEKDLKKLTTIISVTAMMCAVMAALIFSIWLAVYGDSNYRFYKKNINAMK